MTIARIAGDARIAQFYDQRSLGRNGNCLVRFASDCCVASDPCVKGKPTEANKASLSKDISLLSFTAFVSIGFWRQTSKICAIVVIMETT